MRSQIHRQGLLLGRPGARFFQRRRVQPAYIPSHWAAGGFSVSGSNAASRSRLVFHGGFAIAWV
jgi:hypothetical protein